MFIGAQRPEPPVRQSRCLNYFQLPRDNEQCQSGSNSFRSADTPRKRRSFLPEFMSPSHELPSTMHHSNNSQNSHAKTESCLWNQSARRKKHASTSQDSQRKSLHQRLEGIEKKMKVLNILRNDDTKSPSTQNSETNVLVNSSPLASSANVDPKAFSKTNPLPRRPLPLFVDKNLPRRLEYEFSPNSSADGNNVLPSPRRQTDNFDAQAHIDIILKQTGVLKHNGKEYKVLPNDLELLCDLGHGICGHVVKMRHRQTGLLVAVKQMRRSGNNDENKQIIMDLEVVFKSHDCPFIVQYLGCFVTDSEVWICMELMDTCIDKLISKTGQAIPERIIGKIALSVIRALNYLKEKHGVIHRDIKPSNILMNRDGTVKLCDFNISGRLIDSKAFTQTAGCAAYMAPERIQPPDPRNANYDIRSDVWSLGISLVEMALGRFPYGVCENHFEILTKILLTDSPSLSPRDGFSPQFCDFLSLCLTKDFTKRPKYPELLSHPFLIFYETNFIDVAGWLNSILPNVEA